MQIASDRLRRPDIFALIADDLSLRQAYNNLFGDFVRLKHVTDDDRVDPDLVTFIVVSAG
jgi:hypothetical protein